MLLAEEDHFVFEKRRVDRRSGRRVEIAGKVHTVDTGTDDGAEFHNLHGPKVTPAADPDKGSAQCEQNGNVTVVTLLACAFRPPPFDPHRPVASYIPRSCTCV